MERNSSLHRNLPGILFLLTTLIQLITFFIPKHILSQLKTAGHLFENQGQQSLFQDNNRMWPWLNSAHAAEAMIQMSEQLQRHTMAGFRWVISRLHALLSISGSRHWYGCWHLAWHCCCGHFPLHTQHKQNGSVQYSGFPLHTQHKQNGSVQ